jgi:nucleoid-associated protein YgaU
MRIKTFLVIATVLLASSAFAQQASKAPGGPHLAKAVELRAQAQSAYDSGDYDTAASLARQAKAELALVPGKAGPAPVAEKAGPAPVAAAAGQANALPLPAEYVVRLIPERRDCLWRIAEYPFVYGDPLKWSLIYEANKKTFRDPANPDLIFPGQELRIPSLGGETREGTFDSTKQYEPLSKE